MAADELERARGEGGEGAGGGAGDLIGMSHLGKGLLLSWCDGIISASEIQRHMANARRDEEQMQQQTHPMVARLASIGEGQHAHAGLRRLLTDLGIMALQTPLVPADIVTTMALPSTIFRIMFRFYPRAWRIVFGCDVDWLREFWTQFLERAPTREWAARHPYLRNKTAADLVTTTPVVVHTDAGPATKKKSVSCI